MAGRFADPTKTRRVELGACLCEGTPHDSDYVLIRSELSGPEIERFAGTADDEAAEVLASFVVEWNLLGADGNVEPVTGPAVMSMMLPTLAQITAAITDVIGQSSAVPNASGAPSRATSRASASRTPTTRRKR